jgi:hypothetical protein
MAVQLYVQYPTNPNWVLLDLYPSDAEPIKLNFSVADISDPLKVSSVFSRSFRVPHTEVNGPFFRAVFNVNSVEFDASIKAPAYINDNGATFSIGNLRLQSIIRNDKKRNVEYQVLFMGEVNDFASAITGGFMNELDLNSYNHPITYTNIVNSWSGGLFGGDIIYPLIEWGYTYDSNGVPNLPTLAVGGAKGFSSSANALRLNQWKPSVRLKVLWDAVFQRAGYTYTNNSFMNSALFRNLYVVMENQARATLNVGQAFFATTTPSFPFFSTIQSVSAGSSARLIANIEIFDVSNLYNPTSYVYTVPFTGSYQFAARAVLSPSIPGTGAQVNLRLKDVDTNATLGIQNFIVTAAGSFLATFPASTITAGTKVTVDIEVLPATATYTSASVRSVQNSFFSVSTPDVVNLNSLMPNNYKIIDFLKAVIDKFKLVFVPDKNIPKRFEIIPWVDWIQRGEVRDWTDRLDESKDMVITPLFDGQPRNNVFRDISDTDYVNINYQYNFKETFGQLNLDSGNELLTGTQTREGGFAPTPLDRIGGTTTAANTFLIPHLAKDTQLTRDPIQPKPRLLFWNGIKPNPTGFTWYMEGDGSPPPAYPMTSYPLMSSFQQWPPTTNTLDLNWENDPPMYDTTNYNNPPARTSVTVFSQYWSAWYNTIYDPYSRIVEANFVLDYSDIADLKFNDYIWVKDSWYFVNKITDFVVGQDTNCKVELYKIGSNTGITIPLVPRALTQVSLCRGNTECEAYCCNGEFGNASYFTDGESGMEDGTQLYSDTNGNVAAPSGYYSDGDTIWQVGVDGLILGTVPEECDCIGTLYPFEVCFGSPIFEGGLCAACCCDSEPITIYGSNASFWANLTFWANAGGTVVPNLGWYKPATGNEVAYIQGGTVEFVNLCTSCQCEGGEFFAQELNYGATACGACCSIAAPNTFYSDGATMGTSLNLYTNNTGTTGAPAGWYTDGEGDVYQVATGGAIVAIGTCSVCSCGG